MSTYNPVECAMSDENSSMFRYRLALFCQLKDQLGSERRANYAINLLKDKGWDAYNKYIKER